MRIENLEKVQEVERALLAAELEEGPPTTKQIAALIVASGLTEAASWLMLTINSTKEERITIIEELKGYLAEFNPSGE